MQLLNEGDTLTLSPSNALVRLWKDSSKETSVPLPVTWDDPDDVPASLWRF